jgi:hypothetical protein
MALSALKRRFTVGEFGRASVPRSGLGAQSYSRPINPMAYARREIPYRPGSNRVPLRASAVALLSIFRVRF